MEEMFIGITPSGAQLARLKREIREYCSYFNSREPLRYPPHITLIRRFVPLEWPSLRRNIISTLRMIRPFMLHLNRIGTFSNPPIVFLTSTDASNVKHMHNILLDLISESNIRWVHKTPSDSDLTKRQIRYQHMYNSPYVKEFFRCHLTLAGPDVNPSRFQKWRNTPRPTINLPIEVTDLSIYVKNGKRWNIKSRLHFRKADIY